MKLLVQVASGCALVSYPVIALYATLNIDVPKSNLTPHWWTFALLLIGTLLVLSYPIVIGYFLFKQQWSLLWIPPKILLAFTMGVGGLFLFGARDLFWNLARGIKTSGYMIKPDAVYLDGKVLPGADPRSFEIIIPREFPDLYDYARDTQHVYHQGQILPGVDAKTFELVKGGRYLRDATHVFVGDITIAGADPKSLEMLQWNGETTDYWRDKNAAYYTYKRITEANASAFLLINELYAQDGVHVFREGNLLADSDAATFRYLNGAVGKDAARIYFRDKAVLPDADVARFTMRDNSFGEDGRYIYYFEGDHPLTIEADAETFQALDRGYVKDRQRVFYLYPHDTLTVVAGADAASFQSQAFDVRETYDAADKNRRYRGGRPLPE